MSRRLSLASLACACLLWSHGTQAEEAGWTLRMAAQEKVVYHGMPNATGAGTPGAMMYPAPNLVGFLAGVAVHGLLNSSMRDGAAEKAEKAADAVLDPLRSSLGPYTQRDLALATLEDKLAGAGKLGREGTAPEGIVVDSAPVFFLTQARDALVIDNAVAVTRPGQAPHRVAVRVLSDRSSAEDGIAYWGADDARQLKATSADLLARSLQIALADTVGAEPNAAPVPFRTLRYALGKQEVIERGQLLGEQCGRVLIRTLRGGLVSAPASTPSANPEGCQGSAPF